MRISARAPLLGEIFEGRATVVEIRSNVVARRLEVGVTEDVGVTADR